MRSWKWHLEQRHRIWGLKVRHKDQEVKEDQEDHHQEDHHQEEVHLQGIQIIEAHHQATLIIKDHHQETEVHHQVILRIEDHHQDILRTEGHHQAIQEVHHLEVPTTYSATPIHFKSKSELFRVELHNIKPLNNSKY